MKCIMFLILRLLLHLALVSVRYVSIVIIARSWVSFSSSYSPRCYVRVHLQVGEYCLLQMWVILHIINVSLRYLQISIQSKLKNVIQGDSFFTRPKEMRISQRLFIRFWTCIYDYISYFMKSMSILEEMLEMFATTLQAELNATLHVCESGLQDVLTNRSNFTSNVVFQFLYGAWLVGISFSF